MSYSEEYFMIETLKVCGDKRNEILKLT